MVVIVAVFVAVLNEPVNKAFIVEPPETVVTLAAVG
jgi:hypothetical protein